MGLLDFLFDDTLKYFQYLLESTRDSVGWSIRHADISASRLIRSTLESFEHSVVPGLSAALGRDVGLLRIVGEEVLVSIVKLLAAAALAALLLRALPRKAMWGASVVMCVALLQVHPGDFARSAPQQQQQQQQQPTAATPSVPATPHIICTPPLVNHTGRCDCPVGLILDGSKNCVCAPGHTFDGSHCHKCHWPRHVRDNQCVCSHPMHWTGHTCRCPGQLVEGGGGCVCPGNLVQDEADRCIPRMHGGTINWLRVRAGGSVDSLRLCGKAGGCVEAGGKRGSERVWSLQPYQCIVRVEWWWGDSVVGIRFIANDGTELTHGKTDAKYHESHAPEGQCLVGAALQDHLPFKYGWAVRVLKVFRPHWG